MRRTKKIFTVIILTVVIVIFLCGLQYAIYYISNPIENERIITGTGCLILGKDKKDCKTVPIEMRGKILHYLYRNEDDWVTGSVRMNGYNVLGKNDFWIMFPQKYEWSGATCSIGDKEEGYDGIVYAEKELEAVVCGIENTSNILDSSGQPLMSGSGRAAVLVIPAENVDVAWAMVNEAALNSEQFKEWMIKKGFL